LFGGSEIFTAKRKQEHGPGKKIYTSSYTGLWTQLYTLKHDAYLQTFHT